MYKRGNSWVSDFYHEGERWKKSWGKVTKTRAKELDQKFQLDVREGRYPESRNVSTSKRWRKSISPWRK
jgi:hypothetical protein